MSNGIIRTDTILDRIIAHKQTEVATAKAARPLADVVSACHSAPPTRDFFGALQKESVALIAEVKHASPSKGVLIEPFHPVDIAQMYERGGASAISVLTDEQFFQGHLDYLRQIRQAVDLPLLRKEFIIDPYQVYEARDAGADAILLIVAALDDGLLAELHALALSLDMAALVEVHNLPELERALAIPAPLIGVNNRDLHDFSVDLATTRQLAQHVPAGTVLVGESGIKTAADVQALGAVHAILVGETLVTADDPHAVLHTLTTIPRQEVTR